MPTGVYVRTKKRITTPIKDRYWPKVKIGGPDECWPWTGYCLTNGYGIIYEDHKTPRYAHREGWKLARGAIPKDLHVLHRCDNRKCCNPRHWFLGTNRDNVADKVAKGRQLKGEQLTQSKLTAPQIHAVRADPREQKVIAAELGVDQSLISRIKNRVVWKHI